MQSTDVKVDHIPSSSDIVRCKMLQLIAFHINF